jgi:hypothetical protein
MRTSFIILAFATILGPGIAHGLWSDRWEISDEPLASAARLSQVPLVISNWQGIDLKMNPRQIEKAGLAGFFARRYTDRANEINFVVFLTCGKPGPASLHSPDICYPGAGFQRKTNIKKFDLDGPNASNKTEFAAAEFEKPNSEKDRVRVYWSWYASGTWQVPTQPRWTFGNQRVVHKLYVIQPLLGKSQAAEETGTNFLQTLIPELQKSLFSVPNDSF